MTQSSDRELLRVVDREVLKSTFVSMFYAVLAERKAREGYTAQALADELGVDKSAVSRWFNSYPNWTLDTISDIAGALGVDLHVEAEDRRTGQRFNASGTAHETMARTFTRSDTLQASAGLRTRSASGRVAVTAVG